MELALLVGEAVGLIQQEVPAEKFLTDLSSQLRLVRRADRGEGRDRRAARAASSGRRLRHRAR